MIRRRFFTLAAAVSLLLCVATMVLWVLSYATDAALCMGSNFIIESHEGLVAFRQGQRNPGSPQFFVRSLAPDVVVPYLLISPPILLVSVLLYRARGRAAGQSGICRRCGYDLTGNTSGVCPECGTSVIGIGEAIT